MCWNSPEKYSNNNEKCQKNCMHMKWKFLFIQAGEKRWKRESCREYGISCVPHASHKWKSVCSLSCLNNIKCISLPFARHYIVLQLHLLFIWANNFAVFHTFGAWLTGILPPSLVPHAVYIWKFSGGKTFQSNQLEISTSRTHSSQLLCALQQIFRTCSMYTLWKYSDVLHMAHIYTHAHTHTWSS